MAYCAAEIHVTTTSPKLGCLLGKLGPSVIHLSNRSNLAGQPGQTCLYNHIRKVYYWPQMAVLIMDTVRECTQCVKNRMHLMKKTHPIQLFLGKQMIASVAIDSLGPL